MLLFTHTNFLINFSTQYIAKETTGFPIFKFSKKEASIFLGIVLLGDMWPLGLHYNSNNEFTAKKHCSVPELI